MRNIIIFVLFIVFTSCSNENDKPKKLIKEFLIQNLNDSKSYESVGFGELEGDLLDKDMKNNEDCEVFKKIQSDIVIYEIKLSVMEEKSSSQSGDPKTFRKELSRLKDELNSYDLEKVKKCFKSLKMEHTFRSKNKFGGIELRTVNFYFDRDLSFVFVQNDINNY